MESIGIVKELDKLGRIVIPKDMRDRYGITERVELVATKDGVLVKSVEYVLVRSDKVPTKIKKSR
ncbi:MAG: hypothetical protein J6L96_08490 [Clostridia bacterium]|nr:hypothetical protein [Clostridia bacterium]